MYPTPHLLSRRSSRSHRGFPSGPLVSTVSLPRQAVERDGHFAVSPVSSTQPAAAAGPVGICSARFGPSTLEVAPETETHSPNAKPDFCLHLHQIFTGLPLCVQHGSGDSSVNQTERTLPSVGVEGHSSADMQSNQQKRNIRERHVLPRKCNRAQKGPSESWQWK